MEKKKKKKKPRASLYFQLAMPTLKQDAHFFLPLALSCKRIDGYLGWEVRKGLRLQNSTLLFSISPKAFSILTPQLQLNVFLKKILFVFNINFPF